MSALACAATRFMGGNGHFISGCREATDDGVASGRGVICGATIPLLRGDDRSFAGAPADAQGFGRPSTHGELAER